MPDQHHSTLASRLEQIRRRIEKAATLPITLVAITKTHPVELVREVIQAGVADIGENKIQEAEGKLPFVAGLARFHMVGHLQSNKVKKAVALFDMIQSVDSLSLAQEINRRAGEIGKRIDCLIEVNSSGESQKHGVAPDRAIPLATSMMTLPAIHLRGLMTVGPLTDSQSAIEQAFASTRDLLDAMKRECGDQIGTLSMGMSGDFELAIRHGSTMIRLGSILLGERPRG